MIWLTRLSYHPHDHHYLIPFSGVHATCSFCYLLAHWTIFELYIHCVCSSERVWNIQKLIASSTAHTYFTLPITHVWLHVPGNQHAAFFAKPNFIAKTFPESLWRRTKRRISKCTILIFSFPGRSALAYMKKRQTMRKWLAGGGLLIPHIHPATKETCRIICFLLLPTQPEQFHDNTISQYQCGGKT